VRTDSGIPRILIVDDERSTLTFSQRVLSDAGYQVAAALNGPEALALVDNQRPFALFVIDIVMPGMRGDELAQGLLQRFASAKVLYFTGNSDRLFEEQRVLREREAVIEKPAAMNGLLEAVSMSLFGHTRGLAGSLTRAVRCPHCQSVRTAETFSFRHHAVFRCLACAKSFEHKAPTKASDA
jgi:CheY-like chemotaxis protein